MQPDLASTIEARLKANVATITRFAEQKLVLDASGGLFFLQHNTLVVSDLHFEKGSYLKSFASPISTGDTADTLSRLAKIINIYQPHTLICLGDSFHDLNALSRMERACYRQLEGLINGVKEWVWILGNHDPALPAELPGIQTAALDIGNLLLLHQPDDSIAQPMAQIVGHYHPKMTHNVARQSVKGKCFVSNDHLLIMPSFGSYTGGLDIKNEVLTDLLGNKNLKRFLINKNKIWPI